MRYVAFLRAVNVGGRVVKMDELKGLFAMPGIKNISTYIQSGNVVFDSNAEKDTLKTKIENKLLKELGYEVIVFLKSFDDIRDIIKRNPYSERELDGHDLHLSMLSGKPDKEGLAFVQDVIAPLEQIRISGTEAYILVPSKSFGNSKLGKVNLERKLKVSSTTRNWNTMNKILALE
ncbi:MAG: DUF1697 domain-containing protein [Bacteroidetes bacterium]|nr:DUF1697 domain-containing protein [Bacteroidota bacterium]